MTDFRKCSPFFRQAAEGVKSKKRILALAVVHDEASYVADLLERNPSALHWVLTGPDGKKRNLANHVIIHGGEKCAKLLTAKFPFVAKNISQDTLAVLASNGGEDLLRTLLRAGARDTSSRALYEAVAAQRPAVVELLLSYGSSIHEKPKGLYSSYSVVERQRDAFPSAIVWREISDLMRKEYQDPGCFLRDRVMREVDEAIRKGVDLRKVIMKPLRVVKKN